MFRILVGLFILLTIIMICCIGTVSIRVVRNREHVLHLIWTAVFTTVCYTGFILVPSKYYHLAVFMDGLYFLSTDWLVVYLMLFAASYTQISPPSKWPKRMIGLLAGIDSVSFLVNTFTHHMFDLKTEMSDSLGMEYWDVQLHPLHALHRVLVYGIVLYSLLILTYRFIKSPVIYKNKYGSILFQIVAVVGLNVICAVMDAQFDYSVILYASLAISICHLALYASPRRLFERINSTIMEDSVIGLFAYDNAGLCVGINEMAKNLFAGDEDIFTVAEKYLTDWKDEYKDRAESIIGADRVVMKGDTEVDVHVTYQEFFDEKGRDLGCCFQFEDRTEVIRQFREEQYRATHDILTGLLNRNAFADEAQKILSDAQEPYCMVCANIQDFKLINELFGTEAGDKLLIAQAEMIRKAEGHTSVSARIYADKFCTLMPKRDYNEQQFLENMSISMDIGMSSPFKLHYYLGVYDITDVTEPVWTMYDKATMAIDAIRGSYEEYVSYYKDEMLRHIIEEKEVLGGFDKAIEEKQFCMYLQPQFANNGKIVGAEALVRWIHPEKGMISPGVFIPVLEKSGLISRLDLYMWGNAAKTLEKWKEQGRGDLTISVNISTKDFHFLDVCEAFRMLAKQYDFDVKNLKLEITESVLMENIKEITKTIDRLHALGYDIEIDDFGSGYSSLGMLKDIKADILKLDMIFLQETQNVDRSKMIIKNIIAMSKELGMPVITEGVETKEQVDFLTQVECDMFQGFYFAKPMALESFEEVYG